MTCNLRKESGSPYNLAYLTRDRSPLYREYGIDRSLDAGTVDAASGESNALPDYGARRSAILSFYGYRCGRCASAIAETTPGSDERLGYVFSLGRVEGGDAPWALDRLVAVCEPCFDLLDVERCAHVGRIDDHYREAPQFPVWACDPRVAVERAPLRGEELFYRERLEGAVSESRFDFRINDPVAERSALALETPASVAVALGEQHLVDAWRAPRDGIPDPSEEWEALPFEERARYERRVVRPRTIAKTGRWRSTERDDRDRRNAELAP